MTKRILVTGAAGFIGTHTMVALKDLGHDVVGVDNFSSQPDHRLGLTEDDVFYLDIARDWLDVLHTQAPFDVIIHLAAQPSLLASVANPQNDLVNNVGGTVNMIEFAKHHGARLIFSSTSAIYGANNTGYYTEDSIIDPESPYGLSKATAERYIRLLMEDYVILRYGNVYGPLQLPLGENQLIPRFIRHMLYGDEFEIYGDGKQARDFIYVSDVVAANVHAALGDYTGDYNVSTAKATSVNKIVRILIGFYQNSLDPIVNGYKRDNRQVIFMDNNKLKSEGWKPEVSISEGLKATYNWWRAQK